MASPGQPPAVPAVLKGVVLKGLVHSIGTERPKESLNAGKGIQQRPKVLCTLVVNSRVAAIQGPQDEEL